MGKLKYLLLSVILAVSVSSCVNDSLYEEPDGYINGEKLVEFTFGWPGVEGTRAFDDITVKTRFSDGDVIHIVGTFKTKALQPDGQYKEGEVSRYGALRYDGKTHQWEALAGNELTWPSIAESGDFYAYYISKSDGIFTQYNDPVTQTLSETTPQTDPLYAPSTGDIVYGHAVKLDFEHLCTHLTLIDLEPMVAQNYFFLTDEVLNNPTEREPMDFNNAFKLTLVEKEGEPALEFEFFQVLNPDFGDLLFISGNAVEITTNDDAGNEKKITKAGFFLQPGLYEKFSLKYPSIAPETYDYLSYDYNNIPDNFGDVDYEKVEPYLEAGTTYSLTITKSPGITIEVPPPGDGWDDEGEEVKINVPDFLEAVRNGEEYKENGRVILEDTAEGTRMTCNVDFSGFTYDDFTKLSFTPDVLEGKVFDGDHHYIFNLEAPLFRNNYGTIKNVGLKGVKFEADSYEAKTQSDEVDNSLDRSRHGALCMWNRSTATVSNVRVYDVDMTVNIKYSSSDTEDGNEVHNMGCLFGSNTGSVKEIYLGGHYSLTVNGDGDDVNNSSVMIGGIVGQNAGSGNLYDISILTNEFSMNITNTCQSDLGLYAVGGIAGQSSGVVTGVILSNVTIDGTQSRGVTSYMGGMAGNLANTPGSISSIVSCIVGGIVKAGNTKAYETPELAGYKMTGTSYIGGMAGRNENVDVKGCRSTVSVIASAQGNENVLYATGGAFGRIVSAANFENLIAYGTDLKVPAGDALTSYAGNFAGVVPADQSWDNDYANKNIILHSFGSLGPIGASM